VLNLLKVHQADWMLVVATRFEHIANQFNHTILLNQQDGELA
jgi:hypothetical protein